MMTAQVVETSVTVNNNSPIQDHLHPDDQTQSTYEMTPGFKPFTDIKFTLLLVMSDQNFVLSDQDGVLVGHTVLSREKKIIYSPALLTHVWSSIEKTGNDDTASTGHWRLKPA